MILLLNLLFAVLAFLLFRWLAAELGAEHPVTVVVGVIAAVVVFFANVAAQVVR